MPYLIFSYSFLVNFAKIGFWCSQLQESILMEQAVTAELVKLGQPFRPRRLRVDRLRAKQWLRLLCNILRQEGSLAFSESPEAQGKICQGRELHRLNPGLRIIHGTIKSAQFCGYSQSPPSCDVEAARVFVDMPMGCWNMLFLSNQVKPDCQHSFVKSCLRCVGD